MRTTIINLLVISLVSISVQATTDYKPILKLLKKQFSKSSFKQKCSDFLEFADDNHFRTIPLKPDNRDSKYLMEIRCNSGAYNSSYLYFLIDPKIKKPLKIPPMILFPNDSEMIKNVHHQEQWQLKKYQAEVFTRHLDAKTFELFSYRQALGDGSKGYYRKFKIDTNSGLPELLNSFSRIEEDHLFGYHFSIDSQPAGDGWVAMKPKQKTVGILEKFK